ncbi:TetR/AcrR family transcriptional regulator [Leucobacter soli]|uniref:TetR/AcrR family transcriptional regulator n=1 Tax=Leucobacter soli TaxID=2812850 RepID=UPI003607758B
MGRPKVAILNRERIARAALEIADDRGKFTLAQLAKHLGVTSPSLYNHVSGLDEVLELMRETIHVERGPKIDRSWPWQEALRHVAYHDRDSIGQYPWLAADLMISQVAAEEPLASVVAFAEVLRDAGFTAEEVYRVIGAIDLLSAGERSTSARPSGCTRSRRSSPTMRSGSRYGRTRRGGSAPMRCSSSRWRRSSLRWSGAWPPAEGSPSQARCARSRRPRGRRRWRRTPCRRR